MLKEKYKLTKLLKPKPIGKRRKVTLLGIINIFKSKNQETYKYASRDTCVKAFHCTRENLLSGKIPSFIKHNILIKFDLNKEYDYLGTITIPASIPPNTSSTEPAIMKLYDGCWIVSEGPNRNFVLSDIQFNLMYIKTVDDD